MSDQRIPARRHRARRSFVLRALALPAIVGLLASCGEDDSPDGAGSDVTQPTEAPTTAPTGNTYSHPTGADDVVLRIDSAVGGFTTQEYAFQQIPVLLVTGDGRLLRAGAQIEIFPQPLLPAVEVVPIPEAAVQELLAAADESGLLAPPPDYEQDAPLVTDVGSTVVTISAGDETYVHSAYALGMGSPETSPARAALQSFVETAQQVAGTLVEGGEIFEPTEYEVWAQPDDVANYTEEPLPTVQPWPSETGIALGDASACLAVPAESVRDVFEGANQLTFFDDGGVTYRLIVRPVLPGAERCPS